jgi:hypothetical protein
MIVEFHLVFFTYFQLLYFFKILKFEVLLQDYIYKINGQN